MIIGHPRLFAKTLAICALFALTACETSEERAEKHYQNAVTLLADGDVDRALVELRNTLDLNEQHREARTAFAEAQLERGEVGDAIASYLILTDQNPNDGPLHVALGRLTVRMANWEAAGPAAERAFELMPDDPGAKALAATTRFQSGAKDEALTLAREVLEAEPAEILAHSVVVADAVERRDFDTALDLIDTALALHPEDEAMHATRLGVLVASNREADIGQQLERMIALFPDTIVYKRDLIRWHILQGDLDTAETILREAAAVGDHQTALDLVRFLYDQRGLQAAGEELDRLAEDATDAPARVRFLRARAALNFEAGDREAAVVSLQSLLNGREPSDETREIQVTLARMLYAMNRSDEARALVEDAISTDPDMVEALKMRADVLITDDRTDAALADLRRALDQAPRDPQIMTLMARAHEREGAHHLVGERLALAVDVSSNGAEESLRYAQYLVRQGTLGPAESVLVAGLRRAPNDIDLLAALGDLHVRRGDFERVGQVADILARLEGEAARTQATRLKTASLAGQSRTADMIALFQGLAADGDIGASVGLIRTLLGEGRADEAETAIEELVSQHPDHPITGLLQAGLNVIKDDPDAALARYRDLAERHSDAAQVYIPFYALLLQEGREDEAKQVLKTGIERTENPQLLLIEAGNLEREGDVEGAIGIYDRLYAMNPNNPILANNLASLISAHRDGAEDLERAFTIARRLRGTDVPHFQDTYGWILARRGEYAEALDYLTPAAKALADDPLVQIHLGLAQAGAGQIDAAIATLEAAIVLAGPETTLPQIATAQDRLAALKADAAAAVVDTEGGVTE